MSFLVCTAARPDYSEQQDFGQMGRPTQTLQPEIAVEPRAPRMPLIPSTDCKRIAHNYTHSTHVQLSHTPAMETESSENHMTNMDRPTQNRKNPKLCGGPALQMESQHGDHHTPSIPVRSDKIHHTYTEKLTYLHTHKHTHTHARTHRYTKSDVLTQH